MIFVKIIVSVIFFLLTSFDNVFALGTEYNDKAIKTNYFAGFRQNDFVFNEFSKDEIINLNLLSLQHDLINKKIVNKYIRLHKKVKKALKKETNFPILYKYDANINLLLFRFYKNQAYLKKTQKSLEKAVFLYENFYKSSDEDYINLAETYSLIGYAYYQKERINIGRKNFKDAEYFLKKGLNAYSNMVTNYLYGNFLFKMKRHKKTLEHYIFAYEFSKNDIRKEYVEKRKIVLKSLHKLKKIVKKEIKIEEALKRVKRVEKELFLKRGARVKSKEEILEKEREKRKRRRELNNKKNDLYSVRKFLIQKEKEDNERRRIAREQFVKLEKKKLYSIKTRKEGLLKKEKSKLINLQIKAKRINELLETQKELSKSLEELIKKASNKSGAVRKAMLATVKMKGRYLYKSIDQLSSLNEKIKKRKIKVKLYKDELEEVMNDLKELTKI